MIKMLYHQHGCQINFGGEVSEGFPIHTGIRQGCPLSPLLFALVIDILLRRIKRLLPDVHVRAFADDIALVIPDIAQALPILQDIFREMEQVGNLGLNMPKCVFIPLWQGRAEDIQQYISQHYPFWGGIKVDYKGTYLGFVVGPERGNLNWTKPLDKFARRAKEWGGTGLGLQWIPFGDHPLKLERYRED